MRSADPLEFFDLRPYRERLAEAELQTGLGEAIVIGRATLDRHDCELSVMDFSFLGGSMGSAVGEKLVRACESAAERQVPLISGTASGARACRKGSSRSCSCRRPYAPSRTSTRRRSADQRDGAPDDGGRAGELRVAGRRDRRRAEGVAVVHRTSRRAADDAGKAPDDFGLSESNYRYGHVDAILPRPELRPYLARLLRLFSSESSDS